MTPKEFTATVLPENLLPSSKVAEISRYFGLVDNGNDDEDDDDGEDKDEAKKSLAKTLGFRTQERNPEGPEDSIVYNFPLYPEDDILTQESGKLYELKECLLLCNLKIQPQETIRGIGLSSVSVQFPADTRPPLSGCTVKSFNIFVESKGCYDRQSGQSDNYRELLEMRMVRVERGEITEIKLDTIIPLKKQMIYSIGIREVRKTTGGELDFSMDKDVATDPDNIVTVNIDNICQVTLDVHKIKLKGLFSEREHECPRLICKLGFEEL